MNMPANLVESRKIIARNFKKTFGVSMQKCIAEPGLLPRLRSNAPVAEKAGRPGERGSFGRGYPFWTVERPSAEEADRKNVEILSKW